MKSDDTDSLKFKYLIKFWLFNESLKKIHNYDEIVSFSQETAVRISWRQIKKILILVHNCYKLIQSFKSKIRL